MFGEAVQAPASAFKIARFGFLAPRAFSVSRCFSAWTAARRPYSRPVTADGAETVVAWKMALENNTTPTALLLSRQNIKDVPAKAGSTRYRDALQAEKGAYVALDCNGTPDVVLVASGSEVSTLIGGAELLTAQKGLKVRVVSVISEGLFRQQTPEYQASVLPPA